MKICFFDSGMGGLSVLAATIRRLPSAQYLYYADVLSCPLGNKTAEKIVEVLHSAMDFFVSQGTPDAVVIACNTATGYGIGRLRHDLPDIPFFGLEPAVKPAAAYAQEGSIVVLCTKATAEQDRYKALVSRHNARNNIITLPQKRLAALIEADFCENHEKIFQEICSIFSPFEKGDISAVVLGCTHYVFIKNMIQDLLPLAKIFDGNEGVASRVASILPPCGDPKGDPLDNVKIFTTARSPLLAKKYFEILKNMVQ